MKVDIHNWSELSEAARARLLERPAPRSGAELHTAVAGIAARVRDRGDAAVRELTREYDGVDLTTSRVGLDEIAAASKSLPAAALRALDMAIENVGKFHEAQFPQDLDVTTATGVRCQRIAQPIDSVGLYVPAGSAPLPSAAIMLAVPAGIAGCPQRVLCTPPRADGRVDASVLAVAGRCGIEAVFRIGGAQAIAAMAFGTETVPAVDKIFGPGNSWVTAAKQLVGAECASCSIDMPAGPSEVLVIGDDGADANFIAADLLSQAEHGADSQVVLVSTSARLAQMTVQALRAQLELLSRRGIAELALEHARVIVTKDLQDAIGISNAYAPEHLILHIREPRTALRRIRNAGSVFLGPWSPESAGDYCSGTNHVLPTSGAARSYSGLSVDQFMRHMTVQELTREGLAELAPTITTLAELEGLDAHARAVRIRTEQPAELSA